MKLTQEQMILNHLKYDPITPLEALNRYGCMRLAAVIHSLRSKGHGISMFMVMDDNNGKHYAQYSLEQSLWLFHYAKIVSTTAKVALA